MSGTGRERRASSRRSGGLLLVASLAASGWAAEPVLLQDTLLRPGNRMAVIDTAHLHVVMPAAQAELLRPQIARAEVIFTAMAAEADYHPDGRLTVVLDDDSDDHNGFSTVVPRPLVNVQLASAQPQATIFAGAGVFERTFIHELTHHFSNDRQTNGFRRLLERIFGRILPNDPLSLVVAYLSIPAHATMPAFWQEGCAQWAETVYAPAGSAWGGRGRDSLTHMIWRLDVAAGAMPSPGNWRLTWQEWPYGTRVYSYGIAYLRWLDATYGQRLSVWQMIEAEEKRWPFAFNGGLEQPTGSEHLDLITAASAALEREQRAQIALLKQQPLTVTTRLTVSDGRVAAPAWTADGKLFAAIHGPHDVGAYRIVDAQGDSSGTGFSAYGAGNARGLEDGTLVWSELPVADSPWRRSRVVIALPGGNAVRLDGERLLAPDIAPGGTLIGDGRAFTVAAVHLLPAGSQELVVGDVTAHDGWLGASATTGAWRVLPTTGLPWSPAFRPHPGAAPSEIAWVETDEAGSRLLLAPLAEPGKRRVLLTVPARIFHPAWSRDGRYLFLCSDRSGVANAYRLDPDAPDQLVPVTNTLGGVIACVPSLDGKELAVIDHDRHGPYLARLSGDPATWAK
ncbi:MAG: PD40 domain-containing protein, partial [Planctomycetes bacterium]|nr:PD40 domain-containing protein [Planctomycetota bacterium]